MIDRRSIVCALGATALVVGAVGGVRNVVAGAEGGSTFTLQARSDSVGVQIITKDTPAVSIGGGEVAFATPASSQSELDSLGGSRSFASSPYPGDLLVSLPATVSGLFGGVSFPVPGYPFYVASQNPLEPDASDEVGPYSIAAHSGPDESHAEAHIGLSTAPPQVVSIVSRTSVQRDTATGKATASATAEIAPLSISQVLRVGDVRATATASIDPARPNTPVLKSSSLSVGTITVAGVELGLTDKGLTVGGTQVLPVDLSAISKLLAGSGVSIELIPAQETATSIVSAGVRITFQQTFPTFGPTTVRLVLGQVSATADPGQVIGTAATTSAPVVPVQDPGTVVGGTPTIGSVGLPSLAAPTVAPAASVTRVAERTVVHPVAADLTGLYPILLVGGALAVLGSRAGPWRRRLRRTTPGGGPA